MDELTRSPTGGKVVVIGEILVEIMADEPGDGFLAPIGLSGPYPSGAPAIFIDQVARAGQPCAIVSAVGDDDFGQLNLRRLSDDGVDVSAVWIDTDRPTGSAFVRYRQDGRRDFVFNIRHSACGLLPRGDAVDAILAQAGHLHVMGSSLSSPDFVALNLATAHAVKARGGTVSFDPNLRKEILAATGMLDALRQILALTDLFLPSGDELMVLTEAKTEPAALAELFGLGIAAVVHKLGSDGVRFHQPAEALDLAAFDVKEIDPTGAGDCFGGTFVALWLQNRPILEILHRATAAGARAVQHRGPMATSTPVELDHFLTTHHRKPSPAGKTA